MIKKLLILVLMCSANSFGMEQKSLEQLPKDIWIQILALASENLGNLVVTNKFFNILLSDEQAILAITKKKSPATITNDSKGWLANKIKQMWFNATEKKEMEKAKDLIKIVDPNVYDIKQCSALERAAMYYRDPKMVKWLLDNGADPKKAKRYEPFPIAERIRTEILLYGFDGINDSNSTEIKAYKDVLALIQHKIKEERDRALDDY